MKIASTLLAFSLSLTAWADITPREQEIAQKLLKREASFRRMILTEMGKNIIADLSMGHPLCGQAVRRVYATGNSFYLASVDKAAAPLKSFPFWSGKQDDTFNHFTLNKEFHDSFNDSQVNLIKKRKYEEIFSFARSRVGGHSMWTRVFYMTEDPSTIRDWAPYEIEFKVNLEARTVQLGTVTDLWPKALKEIGEKYPEVKKECGTDLDRAVSDRHAYVSYNNLAYFIAEDSGIEVFEYMQGGRWFQVLSPDIFLKATTKGATGGGNRTAFPTYGKEKAPPFSYLDIPVLTVKKASYGDRDVTLGAAYVIDGKESIDYQVTERGDFSLSYQCFKGGALNAPTTQVLTVKDQSRGSSIHLSCKQAQTILAVIPDVPVTPEVEEKIEIAKEEAVAASMELQYTYKDSALFGRRVGKLLEDESQMVFLSEVVDLDHLDTVAIAEWLVKRKAGQESRLESNIVTDLSTGTEVRELIAESDLAHLVQVGFVASTMATETKSTILNFNMRRRHLDNLADLFPKDAWFDLGAKNRERAEELKLDSLQGNIIAVFQDKVKSRTTLTCGDNESMTPYLRSDKSVCLNKDGKMSMRAQVWGRLTMQDVDYFIIDCESLPALTNSGLNALEKLGKPIYSCQEVKNASGKLVRLAKDKKFKTP